VTLKPISVDSHIVTKLSSIIHKDLKLIDCHCQVMAGIAAQLFLYERKEVYIINSSLHSVLYDGKDTWDFDLGFVLRDYKYPSKKLPEIEDIPLFSRFRVLPNTFEEHFKNYYLNDTTSNLNITLVKGLFDGTEEKTS